MIDNLVYAVGGSNRDDGTRSNLNSMERYSPDKDEWEDMPPMHRSRGAASVTALNNCLYAVGGYDSGKILHLVLLCLPFISLFFSLHDCVGQWLCEVERFDPSTNQWCLIAPMHHSRTGVAVTALRGECVRVYVCACMCVSVWWPRNSLGGFVILTIMSINCPSQWVCLN